MGRTTIAGTAGEVDTKSMKSRQPSPVFLGRLVVTCINNNKTINFSEETGWSRRQIEVEESTGRGFGTYGLHSHLLQVDAEGSTIPSYSEQFHFYMYQ